MQASRTKLAVFGESTIFGFGVRERSFGAVTAQRLGLDFENRAGFGATLEDSVTMLEDAESFACVIAMHGTNEAMIRPTERSLRLMPRRWRRRGWMDPRAYYPTTWRRALPKRIESETRWRLKVLLIGITGGMRLVERDDFERLYREFIARLKAAAVPTVVLVGPPRVDERYFPGSPRSMAEYDEIVRRVAAEEDVIYVSAGETLRQWDDYYLDHLHASASGHERITAAIEDAIVQASAGRERVEHGPRVAGVEPVGQ